MNTRHYSTADGLSDNRITVITKDRDGFMWFGSWAGISRFDGHQFTIFKSNPGDNSPLKSNRIDEIVEDDAGVHLWLGAYDKRMYRFDKRSGSIVSLSQLLTDSTISKLPFIRILGVVNKGIWFKTEKSGILLLNNSSSNNPKATLFSANAKLKNRLSSNDISFFHLDSDKNVWLAYPKGLNLLEIQKDGAYKVNKIDSLKNIVITDLAEGKNTIYFGTTTGTLLEFNRRSKTLKHFAVWKNGINKVVQSKFSATVYFTNSVGELVGVNKSNNPKLLFKTKDSSPLDYIYEDGKGILWVGSQRYGVIRFDPSVAKPEFLFEEKNYPLINGLKSFITFEDVNGTVYLSFQGQITSYNSQKRKMESLSSKLPNYHISKKAVRLFYDKNGILWLGTGYEGIDKIVFEKSQFTRLLPSPLSEERETNEIRGVYTDKENRLWAGTKSGEIFLYQNGKGNPQTFQNIGNEGAGVYYIHSDIQEKFWLATKGKGLFRVSLTQAGNKSVLIDNYLTNRKDVNSISSNSIYCILEDKQSRIWAGSYDEGLILIEPQKDKITFKTVYNSFKKYPANGFRKIRHLAQDAQGLIWVATTDGLLVFNPSSTSPLNYDFKTYKKEPGNIKSLGGNDIQYIYPDSKGRVWVLTTAGGLNLAVGRNPLNSLSFINYSTKNGLPSDFLLGCVEDANKNLWIATQNGLSMFSFERNKFQNFNSNDGLGEANFSEASCTRMKDGQLVFGTTNGLITFNPKNIHSRKVNIPLVLTNLEINSKDVVPGAESPLKFLINYTKKVVLDYDQNTISIDFSVLDFHSTEKQRYAFRLLGYDDEWRNTVGQRRATYTKLPPGNYKFEVKSLNDELYKNVPFKTLEISIHPPIWKTWWAYLIYLILICIVVLMLRRNALLMLKLRQRIAVEHQLAELKVDFFNQISHELRTPLTMIINPSEEIQQKEKLTDKGSEYIAIVLANAQRMLRLVNQVLNLRKVQSGKDSLQLKEVEVLAVLNQIVFSFKETLIRKGLLLTVESDFEEVKGWVDENKFEIIVYNIVGNAIKFSDNGGKICVKVSKNEDEETFVITITDDGVGVSENELQSIFKLYYKGTQDLKSKGTGIGLALSKELVQLHGGTISAQHNTPRGLIFKFTLKLFDAKRANIPAALKFTYQDDKVKTDEVFTTQPLHNDLPVLLIVEDNIEMQGFLRDKFASFYHVETASDGEEGLEKAKKILPNLILSDIMMPKKDGIQLLDTLKNDPNTSHIPVVLLSAKFSIESQIEGLKYGADYYLAKPFNWILLKAAVDNILKQRQRVFQQVQNNEEVTIADSGITEYDKLFLQKLNGIVEDKLSDSEFNIDDVAESLGMSRSAFYRKFKSLTNETPIDFVRDARLNKARKLLETGEDNVSVAAYSVGFSSPKYFTLCFKNKFNQTPSEYLKSIKKRQKK